MKSLIFALMIQYFVNDHGTCTRVIGTEDQFIHAKLAKRGIGHRGIYMSWSYNAMKPPRPKVVRTIHL